MANNKIMDDKFYDIDYPEETREAIESDLYMPDGKTPLIKASKSDLVKVIYCLTVLIGKLNDKNIQN